MYAYTPGYAGRRMGQAPAPVPAPAPGPAATPAAGAPSGVTIPAGWPWYRSIWYEPAVLGVPLLPVALGVAGVFVVTALMAKKSNGRY